MPSNHSRTPVERKQFPEKTLKAQPNICLRPTQTATLQPNPRKGTPARKSNPVSFEVRRWSWQSCDWCLKLKTSTNDSRMGEKNWIEKKGMKSASCETRCNLYTYRGCQPFVRYYWTKISIRKKLLLIQMNIFFKHWHNSSSVWQSTFWKSEHWYHRG